MVQTSIFLTLKLLLWKNLILRKRYFFLTLLEFIFPISIFLIFLISINVHKNLGNVNLNRKLSTEQIFQDFDKNTRITYAPATTYTAALMRAAGNLLEVNVSDASGFRTKSNLYSYAHRNLTVYSNAMFVMFEKAYNVSPHHFHYTLTPYHKYLLEQIYYLQTDKPYDLGSTHLRNYIKNIYLPLKMAIDITYMSAFNISVQFTVEELADQDTKLYFLNNFQYFLGDLTVGGYVICTCVIYQILEEKQFGITIFTKVMGLHTWISWIGWFLYSFMVNFLSISIIMVMLTTPLWTENIIPFKRSDKSVIFVFLLLYIAAGITFCFAVSVFFSKPVMGQGCGMLLWIYTYVFQRVVVSTNIWFKNSAIVFPNSGLIVGYDTIVTFENLEDGIKWTNLLQNPYAKYLKTPLLTTFFTFMFNIALYICIIIVGSYMPHLYTTCTKIKQSNQIGNLKNERHYSYLIQSDVRSSVGIRMKSVTKKYKNVIVVNRVTMSIYTGTITVLLGHNGSGKTTMMQLITGIVTPNTGSIVISSHLKENCYIGYCPQRNILFPNLTIKEQFHLCGMLKGLTKFQVQTETYSLLRTLNIYKHQNSIPSKLSQGTKQKVSVGLAIIGKSQILILDEPTSGLDRESRQEIWKLLLLEKESKTIFFTTHDMEEAETLGERIAIINNGQLICYGTLDYLRNKFAENNFNLTIKLSSKLNNDSYRTKIVNEIEKSVQKVTEVHNFGHLITLSLPPETKSSFSKIFKILEEGIADRKIMNVALRTDTVEDLFMRVNYYVAKNSVDRKSFESQNNRTLLGAIDLKYKKTLASKLLVMIVMKYLIEKRKIRMHLFHILFLIFTTLITLMQSDEIFYNAYSPFDLTRNPHARVCILDNSKTLKRKSIPETYNSIVFKYAKHIRLIKNMTTEYLAFREPPQIGAQFIETDEGYEINCLYSKSFLHGAEISFGLVVNAVIKTINGENASVVTSSKPFPENVLVPAYNQVLYYWFALFPLGIFVYSWRFSTFVADDKTEKCKQLLYMAGIHYTVYWGVLYVCNFLMYLITMLMVILVFILYGLGSESPFCSSQGIWVVFLILLTYGCSLIAYLHVCSFLRTYGNINLGTMLLFSILFTGYTLPALFLIMSPKSIQAFMWMNNLLMLLPHYALTFSMSSFALSVKCKQICVLEKVDNTLLKCEHCSYYYGQHGIAKNLIIMFCSFILYILIIVLLESNIPHKLYQLLYRKSYKDIQKTTQEPEDVQLEAARVLDLFNREKENYKSSLIENTLTLRDLLLARNLCAGFESRVVFYNISFGVKPGECFGLLGVNGAGKSSLIRLLTGCANLHEGEARIYHEEALYFLSKNRKKYLEFIGYCPQSNAVLNYLTGREMLYLFAKVRGISGNVNGLVLAWIKLLDLEKHANILCKIYSKGQKRKLSIGIALIGMPLLVVLDEPTNGIDCGARLKLWNTLGTIYDQEQRGSLVLSTHNIEECDSFCDNLAILSNGHFRCFGKISKLKYKYGEGFTIKLKLNYDHLYHSHHKRHNSNLFCLETGKHLLNLMDDIAIMYKGYCTLTYNQKNLLKYRISDTTKKWSKMYEEMEELQKRHSIIHDYYINETNIDEVFLSIAQNTG